MVMAQLAADLRDEGDELHALLSTLSDADWQRPTPFKDWTPDYVMQHLFMGDWMNTLSLTDPARFDAVMAIRQADRAKGLKTMGLEHFAGALAPTPACPVRYLRRRRPQGADEMGRPGYVRTLRRHSPVDGDLGPWPGYL